MRPWLRLSIIIACLFSVFTLPRFFSYKRKNVVVVGAKNNPESQLLGEMMALLIERHTPYQVQRSFALDGTYIAFHALFSDSIDLYVDYLGTIQMTILDEPTSFNQSTRKTEEALKKRYGITIPFSWGFSNSYVLITRNDFSADFIEDLEGKTARYGFDPEFLARQEYRLLQKRYALSLEGLQMMDPSLLYIALYHRSVDVISGSYTDGNILRYQGKVLLEKNTVFPNYEAVTLSKAQFLRTHPQIKKTLQGLQDILNIDKIRLLNEQVAKGKPLQEVAKDFLKSSQLWEK